ncbi:hypothetical protein JW968_01955 [Candidatus Woesearchaeota archaeon]|nr:hypothetical protein [Candidatus Woesearchaeota archaeon]
MISPIPPRKAQVTLFIIIGILLIAAFSIGTYYLTVQEEETEASVVETEVTPYDVSPIRDYVESCLRKVALEAVRNLGAHGGYMDPLDPDYVGGISIDPENPTNSDALMLSPNSTVAFPYWYYMGSRNTCTNCFFTNNQIPSIEMMQDQIDKYIEDNIGECIAGFEPLESIGMNIVNKSGPKAETTITAKDVQVSLKYSLESTRDGTVANLANFNDVIDINLKYYHDYASQLVDGLFNAQFFERNVISVLSSYMDSEFDSLPPIYMSDEGYFTAVWSKTLVKLQIQDILAQHIPMMKVAGTRNEYIFQSSDPMSQGVYNNFLFRSNNTNLSDPGMVVNFMYLNWPSYVDITPSMGDVLQPDVHRQKGYGPIPSSQTNSYYFFYDVSWPVLIEIRNPDDFRGKGFAFNIAYEANFRDNIDIMQWFAGNGTFGPLPDGWMSLESEEVDPAYADDIAQDVRPVQVEKSMFCDPDQRISSISATTRSNDGAYLDGVKVLFGCGTYDECALGVTEFDAAGVAQAIVPSPPCIGGYVRFEKDGFLARTEILDVLPSEEAEFDAVLAKHREYNISVQKFNVDFGDMINPSSENLDPETDQLILIFTKVKDHPFEDDIFETYFYPALNTTGPRNSVYLPDGQYNVQGIYIYSPGFIIPKHCKHICECAWCLCADEYVPDEDKEVKPALMGGIVLNESIGYLDLRYPKAVGKSVINMNILQVPTPPCVDELEEMTKTGYYSGIFIDYLKPTLS